MNPIQITPQPGVPESVYLWAIGGLVVGVCVLAVYIANLHKTNSKKDVGVAQKMTEALINSTHAIENNSRIVDRLTDLILKSTKA